MGRLVLGIPGRRHYLAVLRSIFGANIIGLWLQNEQSGSVCRDYSGAARDGTYTGVTLAAARGPRGLWAPTYDGINDYNNIYSTSLVSVFNGAEGTLIVWAKVSGAGVWTDGAGRVVYSIRADDFNAVELYKATTNNVLRWAYIAGGVNKTISKYDASATGWMCLALTWSASGNSAVAYYNGTVVNTATGLGTWAGALASTKCCIGAETATPTYVWSGAIGPVVLCNRAATAAQIAAAYRLGLPTGA